MSLSSRTSGTMARPWKCRGPPTSAPSAPSGLSLFRRTTVCPYCLGEVSVLSPRVHDSAGGVQPGRSAGVLELNTGTHWLPAPITMLRTCQTRHGSVQMQGDVLGVDNVESSVTLKTRNIDCAACPSPAETSSPLLGRLTRWNGSSSGRCGLTGQLRSSSARRPNSPVHRKTVKLKNG